MPLFRRRRQAESTPGSTNPYLEGYEPQVPGAPAMPGAATTPSHPAAGLPYVAPEGGAGPFRLVVEDVFSITGRGTVVTGKVESGSAVVGQQLTIDGPEGRITTELTGVEAFRKRLDRAEAGQNVDLLLRGVSRSAAQRGSVVSG